MDARDVMLNLTMLVSASIWKAEEINCQSFNVELASNLITVRSVILNLTVIYQRCNVNLTKVDL